MRRSGGADQDAKVPSSGPMYSNDIVLIVENEDMLGIVRLPRPILFFWAVPLLPFLGDLFRKNDYSMRDNVKPRIGKCGG